MVRFTLFWISRARARERAKNSQVLTTPLSRHDIVTDHCTSRRAVRFHVNRQQNTQDRDEQSKNGIMLMVNFIYRQLYESPETERARIGVRHPR